MKPSAVPELSMALVLLAAAIAAAYALGGTRGVIVAVVAFAALALAVAGWLLPVSPARQHPPELPDQSRRPRTWFENYWRLQARVNNGTESLASYRAELGPQLQHLLAARLAEHHGVNLYAEPEVARRLFCTRPGDGDLWAWVDPQQAPGAKGGPAPEPVTNGLSHKEAPGIPAAALSRLVRKLEAL